MSQRLKDHAAVLRCLARTRPECRLKILNNASPELLKCICECAQNTLNKNVTLSDAQLKRLAPHKRIVRELASRKISLKNKKRRIVKQKGGFLLPLLKPILTTVLTNLLL